MLNVVTSSDKTLVVRIPIVITNFGDVTELANVPDCKSAVGIALGGSSPPGPTIMNVSLAQLDRAGNGHINWC